MCHHPGWDVDVLVRARPIGGRVAEMAEYSDLGVEDGAYDAKIAPRRLRRIRLARFDN
jgi:hypothetical protein